MRNVYDLDLFKLNTAQNHDLNPDTCLHDNSVRSIYYTPHSFAEFKKCFSTSYVQKCYSILHNNVGCLRRNFENL